MRVWRLHQPDGEQVEDLRNARRQRVLRTLVGMLDASTESGWELLEAHQQVEYPICFGVPFIRGGILHCFLCARVRTHV